MKDKEYQTVSTERYFKEVAKSYDSFYTNTSSIAENEHVKRLIRKEIQPSERDVIVDLGCGTGLFNDLFPNFRNVFGVDISKEMLEVAKQKHPECLFFRQDMINTSFPSDYADTVVSLFGSMSYVMEPLQDIFNEMHRILRPEGWFFVMLFNRHSFRNMCHGFPSIRNYSMRHSNGYKYNTLAKFYTPQDIHEATDGLFDFVKVVRFSHNKLTRIMPHHLAVTGVKGG
jgi:ubiquinone/menaquinone biosynthesis C-methylase UbiE